MTDTKDTISAPAPEHDERRPKMEAKAGADPLAAARIVRAIDKRGVTWDFDDEPATKQPDGMTEREAQPDVYESEEGRVNDDV
jgi:hypothetical protein